MKTKRKQASNPIAAFTEENLKLQRKIVTLETKLVSAQNKIIALQERIPLTELTDEELETLAGKKLRGDK